MVKTVDTLVEDIYDLVGSEDVLALPDKLVDGFKERMGELARTRVGRTEAAGHTNRALRISNVGKPCLKQTWYGIHQPSDSEPLRPEARIKFLYGDVIEELLLFLAEVSGHVVSGRQGRVEVAGVAGSRDAIIDGTLVDVKSASTYSFNKFAKGELQGNDPFGYIGQIQTYLEGSQDDPLLTDKDRCAFFVMDKTLGHLCLDIHPRLEKVSEKVAEVKAIVEGKEMPERGFEPEPDGYYNSRTKKFVPNGNMKLGLNCSYCSFNKVCYPEARTFLYKSGPKILTKVVKEPNVPEAGKEE